MRIVRFLDSVDQVHYGVDQADGTALRIQGDIFANHTVTHQKVPIKKLLAPVTPPAIMCIGLNYRKHAEETGAKLPEFPILFFKNPSAVQNPNDPVLLPVKLASYEVDWECELAVIIGKKAKNVSKSNALDYVFGYTCGNDVSARDWQKKWGGSQWSRGKTFDTFCPLGPAIVTRDEIANPNALKIQTLLNNEVVQDSSTADMIFDVASLVEFLSGSSVLLPGTVILTGTPSGVGMGMKPPKYLKHGDSMTIRIEKIGDLSNPVMNEQVV
jgi:2-keto-4-pentenoate hydratase/2-oxohepta-3-ene-1,7-dioic acid hydratase in catechol pathway